MYFIFGSRGNIPGVFDCPLVEQLNTTATALTQELQTAPITRCSALTYGDCSFLQPSKEEMWSQVGSAGNPGVQGLCQAALWGCSSSPISAAPARLLLKPGPPHLTEGPWDFPNRKKGEDPDSHQSFGCFFPQ